MIKGRRPRISTEKIRTAIVQIINSLISDPTLAAPKGNYEYTPSRETIAADDKIRTLMQDPDADTEQLEKLIFEAAALRYNDCPYDNRDKTIPMIDMLTKHEPTAKGYKEIVWRCVRRLESGKKKCKHSPTLHEESLHRALVDAINGFCDVREKVKAVLKESVQRTIAPEGKTLTQLEKLKKEMGDEVSRLLNLTLRENDYTKYDSEFKMLSDEIEKINEQILAEREKLAERSVSADRMQSILDRIENTDFRLTEYDDVITRSFIERIIVINKHTIKYDSRAGTRLYRLLIDIDETAAFRNDGCLLSGIVVLQDLDISFLIEFIILKCGKIALKNRDFS